MKFHITGREKSELLGEGILTIILLILLNMSLYVILNQLLVSNPDLASGIFLIKTSLDFKYAHIQLWSWGWIFIILMAVVDVIVVYWRLVRRHHQMQLRHIINELHYIADGHFNHRIPFQLKGQMQRVVASVNALVDSTIKAMEDEREIERSKDELITNVSHDIRTPLTSIIGYLGLIEDKQYRSEEDILKYTHTAYLKSKQMKSLVDDLFEYTKVRQTDAPLQVQSLELNAMLEQIGASFELEANKKGMEINTILPDSPVKIEADPEKLARVFNNLITNALKYGSDGKNIYLQLTKVDEKEIEIRISNDGEPIPEKSLRQVFDRFYRVESSRSKETGGTGLGLAIAQSIIELHHGYIYVESNKNLTSFIMRLPIKHDNVVKKS
ncbi:GHKL domain-containing protein [Ligilactobacillus salivarius]|uniref:histidine kinase n=2 Tax=Ligilactobacillus salivarius TaxID=1624 RepID=C2EIA2_9LACO|nr:ATP-binding protein [Ligilactobacillus salivarius]ATP37472.1 two-component sensor histidine kinase [Ligilactobacillus salivarius]EEJ73759.1 ATPase/histidine kinase/DNA gyrase B/HSP90 domain protein [Ligilactobacillus salivarius DSM 20555 = ATCC 11741]MBE7937818.1 GHKL domain-containing protein [Ligilactobacillus salivarius]MDG9756048.1 ATP-binding protein [Ligilactobacillus salivarius]MDQ4442528.1 ATP-binding protein [Ligilactobacillus salivarius]